MQGSFKSCHHLSKGGGTSNECEGKFDNIIRLFVEVEFVRPDMSVPSCLIEIVLDHFQEGSAIRLMLREAEP